MPTGCTPTLTKTADQSPVPAGSSIGFTITLANPGPNALPGLTLTDPLPAGAGVDWTIADQQGPATCTITGAPPTETSGCGTFTLAAGPEPDGPCHQPDAPDVCAVLDNTATATSPIAGNETGHDSVTVQCPTAVDHDAERRPGQPRHPDTRHRGRHRRQPRPHRHGQLRPVRAGGHDMSDQPGERSGIRQRAPVIVRRHLRRLTPPPRAATSGLSATAATRFISLPPGPVR